MNKINECIMTVGNLIGLALGVFIGVGICAIAVFFQNK